LIILIKSRIISVNVGDSRAILIQSKNKDTGQASEETEFVELSKDHKPDNEVEKARVISHNGRVDRSSHNGSMIGPSRVWLKNENYPGLAMSRSIGDIIASSVGVICDPEIIETDITIGAKYIVAGSDGIWDFLSNRRVMDLVNVYYKNDEIDYACEKVLEEATLLWKLNDDNIDDITSIVVFFNKVNMEII